jgi:hypothetical protein
MVINHRDSSRLKALTITVWGRLLAMIDLGRLLALTIGQVTNIIFGVGG